RPHPPRELEQGEPGSERERRVRRPQVLDPSRRLDPRGRDRGLPLAGAPVVQVDLASPERPEQKARVEARREIVERIEDATTERDATTGAGRLAALAWRPPRDRAPACG